MTNDAARGAPIDAQTSEEVEAAAAAEVDLTQAAHDLPDETTAIDEDLGDEEATDSGAGEGGVERSFAPEEIAETDPRSREELLAELGEAELRRDEYLDDLRRARAEFENFRKRTLREGASQRDAGKAEVVAGLLEVLDDLDRTLAATEGTTDEALAKGVSLVAEKLLRSLEGQGLERVAETGVTFDPNVHEAVQQQPSDDPRDEPTVTEVLRPGYRLRDRVLRAAMVVVEQ